MIDPLERFVDACNALVDWSRQSGYAMELAPVELREEGRIALIALLDHVRLVRQGKDIQ